MKTHRGVQMLVLSGLLCAVGFVIPAFSPLKITLEPASFTLASHVAIFIAAFISPAVAAVVSVGTTLGFLLGGVPIVIVMRALTHVVFAVVCALWVRRRPERATSLKAGWPLGLVVSIIHAVCEVLVVIPFYFGNTMSAGFYAKGFVISVVLLVGVGTIVHSMVDFAISILVWRALAKLRLFGTASP